MFKQLHIYLAFSALSLGTLSAAGSNEELADLNKQDVLSTKIVYKKQQDSSENCKKPCKKQSPCCKKQPPCKKAKPFKKKEEPPCPAPLPPCPPPACCEPIVLLPSQPCPDNWRLSGSFLYLLPTLDDTYFVIVSDAPSTIPSGTREHNDFNFKSGFRVGAEYAFCDTRRELQAFYSHLDARQEKTITGGNLWATRGRADLAALFEDYSGSASSNLDLFYQRVDASLSQRVLNSCGMYFYLQPGVEYAYLRLKEDYSYVSAALPAQIDLESKTWGVGPQIGLGLDYNFYSGALTCTMTQTLSITGLFSGSILMGRSKTENVQLLDGEVLLDVKDEHTWRTIPAFHARAGLNYLVRGCWVGISAGIGYEFNTYLRGLARTVFSDDVADGACTTNYYNFDVQGLYVTGALSF